MGDDPARNAASSVSAAMRCMSGVTWLERLRVIALSVCPNRTLPDAGLSPKAFVASVQRGGDIVVPIADWEFQAGDRVTVFARASSEPVLRQRFRAPARNESQTDRRSR